MAASTAYPASRNAYGVAIETIFRNLRQGRINFLPQRIALIGQGSTGSVYSTDKKQITTSGEVGEGYGYGSPLHLAARQLFPKNGDGVSGIPVTIYPLDDHASGAAAAGDITPGGTPTKQASYVVKIGEVQSKAFVIPVGATVAARTALIHEAVSAVVEMPMTSVDGNTVVDVTAKHEGTSGNKIIIEIIGDLDAGNTFAITQPNGGLLNPDVDTALAQIGSSWETLVINCMENDDTDTLDKISTVGEGRWGATTRKPFMSFSGNTIADPVTAAATSDARPTDRVNGQNVLPGSNELPWVVAARHVARIALRADSDPAYDYIGLELTGLEPGADGDQWDDTQREVAFDLGSSSVVIKDGVPTIGDTITFYKPTGEEPPAYTYACDQMKLFNILYNTDLIFNSTEWAGKPLVPNFEVVTNPNAKKPKMAITDVWLMIDALADNTIISDREAAKKSVIAEIDAQNPKRLNISFTVKLSGNANVISIDLNFGFFFGTPQVVA